MISMLNSVFTVVFYTMNKTGSYLYMFLKDRIRRPEGVNESQLNFFIELGLYHKPNPTRLCSNSVKIT
jgi:hypothetical protein